MSTSIPPPVDVQAGEVRACQVLVVGAGPTGLVLAAQLLARGVRTWVSTRTGSRTR